MDWWEEYYDHIGTDKSLTNKLGLLTNMFTIGSIVSMFIVPPVADRWGRKPPIIVGCLFMVVGGFISTFADGYGMLCGGRFILGFGNSLSQLSSPMLLTEIIHPQHRAPVTAVYNCLWNFGSLSMVLSSHLAPTRHTDLEFSRHLHWLGHFLCYERLVVAVNHTHPGFPLGLPAGLHLVYVIS